MKTFLKKYRFILLGVFAFVFAMSLNFRHALNDYGVLTNQFTVALAEEECCGCGDDGCGGGNVMDYCYLYVFYAYNYLYYYECPSSTDFCGTLKTGIVDDPNNIIKSCKRPLN